MYGIVILCSASAVRYRVAVIRKNSHMILFKQKTQIEIHAPNNNRNTGRLQTSGTECAYTYNPDDFGSSHGNPPCLPPIRRDYMDPEAQNNPLNVRINV